MSTEIDKPNTSVIATTAIVGAVATLAVAAIIIALVRLETRNLGDKRSYTADLRSVRELRVAQRTALETAPRWADEAKGLLRIPIKDAERIVLAEIAADPEMATPRKAGEQGAPEQPAATGANAETGRAAPAPGVNEVAQDEQPNEIRAVSGSQSPPPRKPTVPATKSATKSASDASAKPHESAPVPSRTRAAPAVAPSQLAPSVPAPSEAKPDSNRDSGADLSPQTPSVPAPPVHTQTPPSVPTIPQAPSTPSPQTPATN